MAGVVPDSSVYRGVEDINSFIGAYFEGIPNDGNVLRYSSDNGQCKVYKFN
jgi:probable phosphoglycerate mutase